ncbi:MAG TPA: hypothetical protein PLY96_13080 [Chromatiaceae bacterium]|jgi:uncharacterized membrane protein YphA (DoxX/SURF4 family)|nr:hypothetical protein [Chromatiaceae bacterium]
MDLFMKIVAAAAMGMMVFYAWRAYQQWQQQGPKAEKGDWQAAILPLAMVAGLVVLLIAMVR